MGHLQPLATDLSGTFGLLTSLPGGLVAAIVSFATSVLVISAVRVTGRDRQAVEPDPLPQHHSYRLWHGEMQPLSDAAEKFLHEIRAGPDGAQLENGPGAAELHSKLTELESNGTPFAHEFFLGDGRAFLVAGQPSGNSARFRISELSTDRKQALEAQKDLQAQRQISAGAFELLAKAPVLAWRQDRKGCLVWSNQAYSDLARETGSTDAERTPLKELTVAYLQDSTAGRVEISGLRRRYCLDVKYFDAGEDGFLGFANDVTALVEAEEALSRFVETLTGTFAHLPIGLAIFDRDRRLGMFNPALGDLLKLEPAWLARRPSLREFLERLRENRQMPDQKDFAAWRRALGALEEGAANSSYVETWVLPSGQNFRVVGRPHPRGALAFLFEDISAAVQLEERRRADFALNQALVDRLGEAIAVFNTGGKLTFFNAALVTLWGDDMPLLPDGPTIAELAGFWSKQSEETSLWANLRSYVNGTTRRESWSATVKMRDGRWISGDVSPLPDGSTLTVFKEVRVGRMLQIQGANRGSKEQIMTEQKILSAENFFDGLEDILLPSGVRLDKSNWSSGPGFPLPLRTLRRIVWNMILATVEFAPGSTIISVSRETSDGAMTLSTTPAEERPAAGAANANGGVAFRVLRQFVDRQGGTVSVERATAGKRLTLACRLPLEDTRSYPLAKKQRQAQAAALQ